MPELAKAYCTSCQAPIFWAVTRTGKRTPVNFKPEVRLVVQSWQADPRNPTPAVIAVPTYTSHWATCPDAAAHRRPVQTSTTKGDPS